MLKSFGIDATIIDPMFITGVDLETLESLKANHEIVVTLEDGILSGGFGARIAQYYGSSNMKVLNFGSFNFDYVYEMEHFVVAKETISSLGVTITLCVLAKLGFSF